MGDKWVSCFDTGSIIVGRHDAGPPPPENDDSSLPPYPWVINECHVLTLGASMYMIHEGQNDDWSSDDEWASCHDVN